MAVASSVTPSATLLHTAIVGLQNDHKAKLAAVEAAIHAWHSIAPPSEANTTDHVTQPAKPLRTAFLLVEVVSPASPAATAVRCAW